MKAFKKRFFDPKQQEGFYTWSLVKDQSLYQVFQYFRQATVYSEEIIDYYSLLHKKWQGFDDEELFRVLENKQHLSIGTEEFTKVYCKAQAEVDALPLLFLNLKEAFARAN